MYSEEVIAKANFIQEMRGEKAAQDYLNSMRGVTSNTVDMPGRGESVSTPSRTFGTVGIQTALQEATDRIAFYTAEVARAQTELQRAQACAEHLRKSLEILTGKAPAGTFTVSGNGTRAGRVSWTSLIARVLKEKDGQLTKKELCAAILELQPERHQSAAMAAVYMSIKRKIIRMELDKCYFVPGKQIR